MQYEDIEGLLVMFSKIFIFMVFVWFGSQESVITNCHEINEVCINKNLDAQELACE